MGSGTAADGEAQLSAMLRAADRALGYLEQRVLDQAWAAEHRDIAYYFKAPMAFLLAGRREQAGAALEALKPYLAAQSAPSASAAYAEGYPHYPSMWAARVALELGDSDTAAACDETLRKWQAASGAGLVKGGDEDLFATAMLVCNALTFGRLEDARRAADVLVRAVDANAGRSTFSLRWSSSGDLVEPPAEGAGLPALFYEVDADLPGQLYFMLAFPAMVLLELADRGGGADHLRAARSLCAFLSSCKGVEANMLAHKAAVSAAMAGDRPLALAIAAFLVSQQREHGGFAEGADAMDTVDQSAEIACWLRLLPRYLAADASQALRVFG